MIQGTQTPSKPAAVTIERRFQLPYAAFEREYLLPNKPVVIGGCLEAWPALGKWSPEFLRDNYGAVPVQVEGQTRPLSEFIDQVLASTPERPAPYLKDAVVRRMSAELIKDIEPFVEYSFPNWLPGRYLFRSIHDVLKQAEVELFLGGRGARLGELHYDYVNSHTVLCQIFGRKEFTLFSPTDTPWLYATGHTSALTSIDRDEVDLEQYPLYARATPIRFIQEPGEIIFLPRGWWHTTRMLSTSIAVGVNFANASNWAAVTDDLCGGVSERKVMRRGILRAYLTSVGYWKRLQGLSAGANKLGIRPASRRV